MDENQINKCENLFSKTVKEVNELNKQINAEYNHGSGFGTKALQKDFVEYFDTFFKKANEAYEQLKNIIQTNTQT